MLNSLQYVQMLLECLKKVKKENTILILERKKGKKGILAVRY